MENEKPLKAIYKRHIRDNYEVDFQVGLANIYVLII